MLNEFESIRNGESKESELSNIWNAMVSTYAKKDDLINKMTCAAFSEKEDLLGEVDKLQTQFYCLENRYYDLKSSL